MNRIDDLTFTAIYSILQSGMWMLNDLEAYLKPLGLSQARLTILLSVMESPDGLVSPHEIAMITGKSRPGITRMIERLEVDGLISVLPDTQDGRKKQLSLTEKGVSLLDRIIPEYNEHIAAMAEGLTDDDKALLCSLLGKIDFLDAKKHLRRFS